MAYQGNNGNLNAPMQQRRMTTPVGSLSSVSLSLPESQRRVSPRPPSPLRHGFVADTGTGIDLDAEDDEEDDEDDGRWHRSPSPASSTVSGLAASFVQRVNTFVGGIAPKSPFPSDAELEAEAELERERSRREAEAIMSRERSERKLVEDRVLEMIENAKGLPPPPARSQTMPNPPSPASSHKESTNWWTAAKNKLTPTKDKEPLTPAQQVIQDAKFREKDKKGQSKGKERASEWPAVPHTSEPVMYNLNIPRKPVPSSPSPSSPTPSRPSLTNMPPNLTPSPMRTTDSLTSSPSREGPPLYAQFNPQGTLDVAATLLMVAKRFEKLEKWTVGHVRALEDRMNDVERWLVDKEKEKGDNASVKTGSERHGSMEAHQDLQEVKDELLELQSRMGEMGREMARIASGPSRNNHSSAPSNSSSMIAQNHTGTILPSTPHHRLSSSTSAMESTSPPLGSNKTPSGTRLPYPQGDYTSPSDAFSPPNSPPGSLTKASRSRAISGLPSTAPASTSSFYSTGTFGSTSSISLQGAAARASPVGNASSNSKSIRTASPSGLPPPKALLNQRQSSVSPTPRKRYTVALGGPIVSPDELSSNTPADIEPPRRVTTPKSLTKAFTSDDDDDEEDDDETGLNEDTIGKSLGSKLLGSLGDLKASDKGKESVKQASPSPMSSRRIRAQSAYGFSSIPGAESLADNKTTSSGSPIPTVAPLRVRSKSSERLNSGMSSAPANDNGKWVDPLILRKQSREILKPIAMPRPIGGKASINQLVAFFDKNKP